MDRGETPQIFGMAEDLSYPLTVGTLGELIVLSNSL
jgi:hypothetical protein